MKIAVSDRYLEGNNTLVEDSQSKKAIRLRRNLHLKLINWFKQQSYSERSVEEISYQLEMAKDWKIKIISLRVDVFLLFENEIGLQKLLYFWLLIKKEI